MKAVWVALPRVCLLLAVALLALGPYVSHLGGGSAAGAKAGGTLMSSSSLPAASSSSSSADRHCPRFRGEYDPAEVLRVAERDGWDLTSHSQVPDWSCPRFVYSDQNRAAGFGHRLNQWAASLHVARTLARSHGVTFAAMTLDLGIGQHGTYNGWDAWLNLSAGEYTFHSAHAAAAAWLRKEREREKEDAALDLGPPAGSGGGGGGPSRMGSVKTKEGEWMGNKTSPEPLEDFQVPGVGIEYLRTDRMLLRPRAAETWLHHLSKCGRISNIGKDRFFYDHSTSTKALMATRAHAALKGGGAGSMAVSERLFDPSHFNIAAHVRVGDQYPTHERVHAGIIVGTILPALAEAKWRGTVSVHVFAATVEGFTNLLSLENGDGTEESRGGGGWPFRVRVHLQNEATPPVAFWHMAVAADALVMSYSSFSWAAGHLSLRPLVFSPRSSDEYRMCGDTFVCCDEGGKCQMDAHWRAAAMAKRAAAMQRCGSWIPGGRDL